MSALPPESSAGAENVAARATDRPWLTVAQVAELTATSEDFVREHASELGGRRMGLSRKAPWRFPLEDLLAATAPDSPGVLPLGQESSAVAVRRRRTGSGTGAPLLPIRGRP